MRDFAPYWFDNRLLEDFLFAFPQSSQVFGYNAYCWDDPEIANEDITSLFKEFKGNFHAVHDIIAGASQGGKLAIELSLNSTLAGKGFIAVIPAIQNTDSIKKLLEENTNKIKGCIITGDQDPFYPQTVRLAKLLEENDIACKFIVKEGLGHFFPKDFTKLFKEAIAYILA